MKAGIRVQHPATGKTLGYWRLSSGVSFVVLLLVGITRFALPETAFAGENDYSPTITILVHNYSQASPAILARAEREAGRIMGEAGLLAVWLECPTGPSTAAPNVACQKAAEATDVRLRVLTAPVQNKSEDTVFGFTVHPVLATVYYEYAVRRAKSDNAEFEIPIILGCVIAHELGHLLLGSNGHSDAGIMRPRWEPRHVRQLMMGALSFTTEQSMLMRAQARTRVRVQAASHLQAGLAQGQQGADVSLVNDSHEIPFRLHESYLIAVEGRIGNLDKLQCVIDTGASHSVVNKRIAQRLELPREPGRLFRFERYTAVEWAVLPEVQIGPITVRDAKFIVGDQSLDIPRDIDAIIGLDILAKTSGFLIDYAAKMISFRNVSASQSNRLTCLTAQMILQGHPVNLVADTGMHGFLLYENLRKRFPGLKFRMEKTVSIGQIRAKQAKVSGMRLGSRESEVVVYLIRKPSQGTPPHVDGYFGMDALNAKAVEFDFENRRLRWD